MLGQRCLPKGLKLADKVSEAVALCQLASIIDSRLGIPHAGALGLARSGFGGAVDEAGSHINQQCGRGCADERFLVRQKTQGHRRQRTERGAFDVEACIQSVDQQHIGLQAGGPQAQILDGIELLRQDQAGDWRHCGNIVQGGDALHIFFALDVAGGHHTEAAGAVAVGGQRAVAGRLHADHGQSCGELRCGLQRHQLDDIVIAKRRHVYPGRRCGVGGAALHNGEAKGEQGHKNTSIHRRSGSSE